jgi:vitamin B12 transporter
VFYSGRRFDDAANEDSAGRASRWWTCGRSTTSSATAVRVQAKVDNLLDEDYQTVANYNQPGRTLMLTLRYEP